MLGWPFRIEGLLRNSVVSDRGLGNIAVSAVAPVTYMECRTTCLGSPKHVTSSVLVRFSVPSKGIAGRDIVWVDQAYDIPNAIAGEERDGVVRESIEDTLHLKVSKN